MAINGIGNVGNGANAAIAPQLNPHGGGGNQPGANAGNQAGQVNNAQLPVPQGQPPAGEDILAGILANNLAGNGRKLP